MAIKRAIVRYLCAKVRKSLEKEMKKVVFVLITILFTLQAQAQESQEAFSFLRLPVSAHVAALGGDNITIDDDDPTVIFVYQGLGRTCYMGRQCAVYELWQHEGDND